MEWIKTIGAPSVSFVAYMGLDTRGNPSNTSVAATMYGPLNCTVEIEPSSDGAPNLLYLNRRLTSDLAVERVLSAWQSKYTDLPRFTLSVESTFDAGGLAGSASLMAGISKAIARFVGAEKNRDLVSAFAALGSGSAARSSFDGFVVWSKDTGKVSEIIGNAEWEDFRAMAVVLTKQAKFPSSHAAHRKARGSSLFLERSEYANRVLAPKAIRAIRQRDLGLLGSVTEEDSLLMHRCLANCNEPFSYLTSEASSLIQKLRIWRKKGGTSVYFSLNYGSNFYLIVGS